MKNVGINNFNSANNRVTDQALRSVSKLSVISNTDKNSIGSKRNSVITDQSVASSKKSGEGYRRYEKKVFSIPVPIMTSRRALEVIKSSKKP